MIDLIKAKKEFKKFIDTYKNQEDLGFELKVTHTYHVAECSKLIAQKLNLSKEDIELAELIGLLHDVGRFEEIKQTKGFSSGFNHAMYGSKMLFEQGMIRRFIEEDCYDEIIKKSIENHSKFCIDDGLDERSLLHAKIIRDSDKLDNYRVKQEEDIKDIFPGTASNDADLEESFVSDKVYQAVMQNKCVDIKDRKTPLDYWVCVLAFTFDLNFKETFEIVKEKEYIKILIQKYKYKNPDVQKKMNEIREVLEKYIDSKI